MRDIVIVGTDGMAGKVLWLIRRLNMKFPMGWRFLGYIDDHAAKGAIIAGYPVLGNIEYLSDAAQALAVACAVNAPEERMRVISCLGSVLSEDVILGDFNIIDFKCHIGQAVHFSSYVTVHSEIRAEHRAVIGQGAEIGKDVWIGAGKIVRSHDLVPAGTAVETKASFE